MEITLIIHLTVLMLAALATIGLMVNWIGLARAMARLSSDSGYTELHQATNQTFDPYSITVVDLGGKPFAVMMISSHCLKSSSPIRLVQNEFKEPNFGKQKPPYPTLHFPVVF